MRKKAQFNYDINSLQGLDLNIDPDQPTVFKNRLDRVINYRYRGVTRVIREILGRDQHDNYLIKYESQLPDGEIYDWADYIKPSMYDVCGGWTAHLFAHYRKLAMKAFAKSESQIPNEKLHVNDIPAPDIHTAMANGAILPFPTEPPAGNIVGTNGNDPHPSMV